jgi:hypothetical protein
MCPAAESSICILWFCMLLLYPVRTENHPGDNGQFWLISTNLVSINSLDSVEFNDAKIVEIDQDWDKLWLLTPYFSIFYGSHGWQQP